MNFFLDSLCIYFTLIIHFYFIFIKYDSKVNKLCLHTQANKLLKLSATALSLFSISLIISIYYHIENNFLVSSAFSSVHSSQPILFKITSVWGSHSGSMLLWCFLMSAYHYIFCLFVVKKTLYNYEMIRKSTKLFSTFIIFFIIYMMLTSNPLLRLNQINYEGNELSPVLQDIILSIHPPIIYIGYLGCIIPFIISLASFNNYGQKLPKEIIYCMKWFSRISWIFLTIGILLGSWWAYYELGWGGFWFWDPVENASLLPWLIVTIFLHESFSSLLSWRVIGFLSFYSSVLGTFFVRSGFLDSVHSFASDNQRGAWILFFLISSFAWFLYNIIRYIYNGDKGKNLQTKFEYDKIAIWSQMILLIFYIIILVGTFFPAIYNQFYEEGISIGPSFYNKMMIPFLFPTLILMTFSSYFWRISFIEWIKVRRLFSYITGIFLGFLFTLLIFKYEDLFILLNCHEYYHIIWNPIIISIISLYLILNNIKQSIFNFKRIYSKKGSHLKHIRRRLIYSTGVLIIHMGVGVGILGLSLWTLFSKEKHIVMFPGDQEHFANKTWIFREVNFLKGPNYDSFYANFSILKDNLLCGILFPEKRCYHFQNTFSTKVDIQSNFFTDYHIIIGDGNIYTGWITHLYYFPFISFLWLSGLCFIVGICLLLNKRL